MKPTEEQIKKLWEWCGFTYCIGEKYYYPEEIALTKKGFGLAAQHEALPEPTLNNLFKWAILKAIKELAISNISTWNDQLSWKETMHKLFSLWVEKFWSQMMTIEDALFWTIWEIMQKKKDF